MISRLIRKNDVMVKKVSISFAKLLALTLKFISGKQRIFVRLSYDGLTIDISPRHKSVKKKQL